MRKLTLFNFITLNGYYKGADNDISWHRHDAEGAEFSANNMKSGNMLLFGRTTYEMMASWWPTPMAAEAFPVVAKGMNSAEKIVFSNTIEEPKWNNTTVMNGDIAGKIRQMKQQPGPDMTILGSGSIGSLFLSEGLIDEVQLMIDPVVLSSGTAVFNNIKHSLNLEFTDHKVFKSGTILLFYKPVKS